jgi:hypothetical protein
VAALAVMVEALLDLEVVVVATAVQMKTYNLL